MIGRVLVCAAILHSKRIENASDADISKCLQTLINASHHKTYHSSLAYKFLLEMLEFLNPTQFERLMWPQMQKELKRPWEKQNINTVHFLIECQTKYPIHVDEEYLSTSIRANEILTTLAFKHLSRLYWHPTSSIIAATHPSYDSFGHFLSRNVSEKMLLQFWQEEINEILLAPTQFKEYVTLRILTIILDDCHIKPKTVKALLSNSFIKLITKSLRQTKQEKQDHTTTMYKEFFESIEKYMQAKGTEQEKVEIIERFIDFPGTLLIEKYTPNRFIHKIISSLKSEGVHALFEFYKSILLDRKLKNPRSGERWLRIEKEHCIQMLQKLLIQKSVQNDHGWKAEQLTFLMKFGLFYVNKKTEAIVSKERDSEVLPHDSALKFKFAFFSSLQAQSNNLDVEKDTLLSIIEYCNQQITSKNANKIVRYPFTDEALESWNKMYATVTTKMKKKKILHSVFDILLMHMGLQLFVDTSMAIFSINDLEKCMERSKSKLKSKTKSQSNKNDEIEWIEVVVDLFLQLLSQNKSFLRNVIDKVFPQLCHDITAPSIDQILLMLDMNQKNPLTPNELPDESSDESDSDSIEDNGSDAGSVDMSDDAELTEEEDEEEEDDNDGTATDQLRSTVSQALGSALPETDTESVDLNDMDENEANRLDVALSEAFKHLKKSTGSGKKKTKLERSTNTTVMHFRIRVLDLLEIYLKTSPSLELTLNILSDLIPMYEHCAGNKDLEQLTNRLNRVLRTLFNLRKFNSIENVSEAKLFELFYSIINIKANFLVTNAQNNMRTNIIAFLIAMSQSLKSSDQMLLEAIAACLEQFLKSRNPKVQQSCFLNILQLRWNGAWQMGQIIAKISLLEAGKCRPFRRIQAIELLKEIFKNHSFIEQHIDEIQIFNSKIEVAIQEYVQWLLTSQQISSNEFTLLLRLLLEIKKCSEVVLKYNSTLKWKKIAGNIQSIRQRITINSQGFYSQFCKGFGLKEIKNSEINASNNCNKTQNIVNGNGNHENDDDTSDEEDKRSQQVQVTNGVAQKRKSNSNNHDGLSKKRKAKLELKLRKENRLKMASIGFDNISFSANHNDVDQNIDSD